MEKAVNLSHGGAINNKAILIKTATIIMVAFCFGRAMCFGDGFCAGLAMMGVLMGIDSIYIYLLPVVWIGMISRASAGIVWGDFWAAVLLCLVIAFVGKRALDFKKRLLLGELAFIGCNCGYLIMTARVYLLDFGLLAKEGVALALLMMAFERIARGYYGLDKNCSVTALLVGVAVAISSFGVLWLTAAIILIMMLLVIAFEPVETVSASAIAMGIVLYVNGMDSDIGSLALAIVVAIVVKFALREVARFGWFVRPSRPLVRWAGEAVDKIKFRFAVPAAGAAGRREGIVLERNRENYALLAKMYRELGGGREVLSYQLQAMSQILARTGEELRSKGGRMVFSGRCDFGGAASGDTHVAKSIIGGASLMLISDGMGKGEGAADESKIVVRTIERLLDSGVSGELALKTVNGALLGHNGDNFATVDMAIIDHERMKCTLYKMGASITFLKRKGKVFPISQSSLPAGVVENVKIESLSFKVKKGDMLVMVSDGVIDCDRNDEDGKWIVSRLEEIGSKDPEIVSRLIMNKAIEKYGIKERDDLTVLAGYVI